MTAKRFDILRALDDPKLFAPHFERGDWSAWRAFLAAAFGLPMTPEQLAIYRACTGRTDAPAGAAEEAWLVVGRRGGKSRTLATLAVYLAAFRDYRPYLSLGETAVIPVIATDRSQADQIYSYARAIVTNTPMLAKMLAKEPTANAIDLNNAVSIQVATNSFRGVRGRTIPAALLDELAFWYSENSANPDFAVIDAIRPAMSTIPNSLLLCASSPHSKRGALYDAYRRYYGKSGPILVWKAPSRVMNPTLRQSVVDRAYERDADVAASEYGAEFRTDLSGFVDRDTVLACVDQGVKVRPPIGESYVCFVDPSGGSSDSMTMAIAHREGAEVVVDCICEERAPFVPENVVAEFVKTMQSYGISRCVGDRYAGQWVQQAFEKHSIRYDHSELAKSGLYIDFLPLLNSGNVRLLDNDKLVNQLAALERRTARGGRDSVDHPPGGKDDVANAVAGVATLFGNASHGKLIERARDMNLEVVQ